MSGPAVATGASVSGVVSYAIVDPMSILYCFLAIVGILFFYVVFRTAGFRHIQRTEAVDREAATLNLAKWRDKILEKTAPQKK